MLFSFSDNERSICSHPRPLLPRVQANRPGPASKGSRVQTHSCRYPLEADAGTSQETELEVTFSIEYTANLEFPTVRSWKGFMPFDKIVYGRRLSNKSENDLNSHFRPTTDTGEGEEGDEDDDIEDVLMNPDNAGGPDGTDPENPSSDLDKSFKVSPCSIY